MKKIVSIWCWAAMLALCIGVTSCSKDKDEGGGNGNGGDFSEVTINGKTHKEKCLMEVLGAGMYGGLSNFCLIDDGTAEYSIVVSLFTESTNQKFQNSIPGTYRLGGYDDFDNYKNLDLEVGLDGYDPYREFQVQGEKVHNVTDIKFIKVDDNGFSLYSVSGNYSCKQKDPNTGKIYDIKGKYKRTITLY